MTSTSSSPCSGSGSALASDSIGCSSSLCKWQNYMCLSLFAYTTRVMFHFKAVSSSIASSMNSSSPPSWGHSSSGQSSSSWASCTDHKSSETTHFNVEAHVTVSPCTATHNKSAQQHSQIPCLFHRPLQPLCKGLL